MELGKVGEDWALEGAGTAAASAAVPCALFLTRQRREAADGGAGELRRPTDTGCSLLEVRKYCFLIPRRPTAASQLL